VIELAGEPGADLERVDDLHELAQCRGDLSRKLVIIV